MASNNFSPLKLREIILNTQEPLVFKNFPLSWLCFQKGLEEWCQEFDKLNGSEISFERVPKNDSCEPQWERKRKSVKMTACEFLREHSKDCEYWSGLNYKRRHELPSECTDGIDFSVFGFPYAADDATLWLSSQGANTPCHYDSYGCNIVVQVFGKKSWLLLPPNTPLTTTRIPYEESSVYCKENFYAPHHMNIDEYHAKFKDLVHHVVLEPNDVLIVPKHWWHYVEALNISLSVNAWIPLKCDLEQQMEECIVKYLIESFIKNCSIAEQQYIMNPNQFSNISTKDELFKILEYLSKKSLESTTEEAKKELTAYDYQYLNKAEMDMLLRDFASFIKEVRPSNNKEFVKYLKRNSSRVNKNTSCVGESFRLNYLEEILINSVCSPLTIKSIQKEFLQRYQLKNKTENLI